MPEMQIPLLESEKGSEERKTREEIKKQKQKEANARYLLKYPERRRATYTKYRKAHPEKHRAASRKHYWTYLEHRRKYARERYWANPEVRRAAGRILYKNQRTLLRKRGQISYQKLRMAVYAAYGGPKCNCCGENEIRFLSMDHIDNNGGEHRKEIPSTKSLLGWLKKNNFPTGFQVLCMQCNFAKGKHNICPHQQMKTPIDIWMEQS